MNKRLRLGAAAAASFLLVFLLQSRPAGGQACVENSGTVSETFQTGTNLDLPQCSAKLWYADDANPRDIMTLNKLGANFAVSQPASVPGWISVIAAGDFNLDGWIDYIGSSSEYSNALLFVRNDGVNGNIGTFVADLWIDGSTGNSSGIPTQGVGGAAIESGYHGSMTAGDYDGDGDLDFFYVTSVFNSPYTLVHVWLFENRLIHNGVNTGVLEFVRTDLTSAWRPLLKTLGWSSTGIVSLDLDGDGDVDMAYGNTEGKVFKITNTGSGKINASTFIVDYVMVETGWTGLGVSTISIAEFDESPGLDMIVGSCDYPELKYYRGDGLGGFEWLADFTDPTQDLYNNMYDGAATISLCDDFDGDGDIDLIIGTDNWCWNGVRGYPGQSGIATGYGGKCYYFKNGGNADFTVSLVFDGQVKTPKVYDFDCGMILDYNNDGQMDFLMADGNHTDYYYVFLNSIADVYNLKGVGLSTNLTPSLPGTQYAITRARFTIIDQGVIGSSATGLTVTYYLSNDDGFSWEYYGQFSGSAIANVTNQAWHDFHTFGSKLRWKAVLTAPDDAISGFGESSYETPSVDRLAIEYVYVERREYSRSSAAAAAIISGTRRKLIISSSFMFPGYEGQLRAYDVTDIGLASTGGSTLQTISTADPLSPTGRNVAAGGSILWDAGQLLAAREASDRTIFTAYKPSGTLTRIDFTEGNVNVLKSLLSDPNGDNAGLIRFVRGEDRTWKLGDILHSSPVLMGPPSGDAVALGSSYSDFAEANASRTPVIFIGANDGMLHCFDLASGDELWGFIPFNLIPKLKNMSVRDANGARLYNHDYFVDGTPTVGDAYINGRWRTVLMCGQGAGKGSTGAGGLNYYFALDVTDPNDPLPLWEAKDSATMGETWSVPAFGQVVSGTTPHWVAFVGSGYDNDTARIIGNRFYVIRLDTGAILKTLTVATDVNTSLSNKCPKPYPNIQVTVPGSPTAVDINRDGRTDYVYFGDLDGRLYRVPFTSTNANNWALQTIYTDRMSYPIITKPAVFPDPASGGLPLKILFGTGGDDRAPGDRTYAFIGLTDTGSKASVEWYIGNKDELGLAASLQTGEMATGEKIWSDPVISDRIVYFSSLMGSIENVNPCLNLAETGRLYARYVQTAAGCVIGESGLKSAGGSSIESLQLASKARRAVTVGELQAGGGSSSKKEVYIQEYDSTIERLEQPVGSNLRVVSWREIYKIIR
jgi:Tfp pilus assembly protein, tip-associated adhesin PilY1